MQFDQLKRRGSLQSDAVFGANSEKDRCAPFRLIVRCARVCPRESPFGGQESRGKRSCSRRYCGSFRSFRYFS